MMRQYSNKLLIGIALIFIGLFSASSYAAAAQTRQQQSLWPLIRKHFRIHYSLDNPAIQEQIHFFLIHRDTLNEDLDNALPYIAYVYQQTQKRHMPAEFALLPMIESNYDPYACSSVGACGMWQLMPGTASSLGLNIGWWSDGRRSIIGATNSALNFLYRLHSNLGNWKLAAAGYNAGQGAVQYAIDYNKLRGRPTDFWALPLPEQTQQYVPKLLALAAIIKNPKKYNVTLPAMSSKIYFAALKMKSQMDIGEIAHLSGVSRHSLNRLNAGWSQYASTPGSTYTLLIPQTHVATFLSRLQKVKGNTHVSWRYHRVRYNESLADIARHYHTSVSVLEHVNHLRDSYLRGGQGLLVPVYLNKKYALPESIRFYHPKTVTVNTISPSDILDEAPDVMGVGADLASAHLASSTVSENDNLKSLLAKLAA